MAVAGTTQDAATRAWPRLARARGVRRPARGEHLRRRDRADRRLLAVGQRVLLEPDNSRTSPSTMAPIALIAGGEVMLLICGEIDLSVGRVFALTPIIMYLTTAPEPDGLGLPIWLGYLFPCSILPFFFRALRNTPTMRRRKVSRSIR